MGLTLQQLNKRPPGVMPLYYGKPLRWWGLCLDSNGNVFGVIARYEPMVGDEGRKAVVPYFRRDSEGLWMPGYADGKRRLFGLHSLPADRTQTVYVQEGEPKTAALHSIDLPCVTSPGGSSSAALADWSPLAAYERVVIIPDRNPPGEQFARDVVSILHRLNPSIRLDIARFPNLAEDEDLADELKRRFSGWDGFEPVPAESVDDFRDELTSEIEACAVPAPLDWLELDDPSKPEGNSVRAPEPWLPCNVMKWFMKDPPARAWVLLNMLAKGDVGLLIAAGGVGKTWFLLILAMSVASGVLLLPSFRPARPMRVLFLSGEDGEEVLWSRVRHIAGLFTHEALIATNLRVYAGLSEPLIEATADGIKRTHRWDWLKAVIEEFQPDLIIIDPKARFDGTDENDAYSATAFVVALQELAGQDAAIIVAHHIRKSSAGALDSDAARGSGALRDAVRWAATMAPISDAEARDLGVENPRRWVKFDQSKSNYCAALDRPIYFRRGPGGVLEEVALTDSRQDRAARWIGEWVRARGSQVKLRDLKQRRNDEGKVFGEDLKLEFPKLNRGDAAKAIDRAIAAGLVVMRTEGREVLLSAPSSVLPIEDLTDEEESI